jgi:hypothetical protein
MLAMGVAGACGGEPRRPNVPPSRLVADMKRSAGPGIQDCGEAHESREEEQCRIKPVGDCLDAALKACRPAFGLRTYFASEGDPVRADLLVLSDGHGGCDLVVVEDRSADPLAAKKPQVSRCQVIAWKPHTAIEHCEDPVPDDCKKDAPKKSEAPEDG